MIPGWRIDAAKILEELFPVTPADEWNLLLELRQLILNGTDWPLALDVFLRCRERMEADHYLPFYRLRRLIAASLRMESAASTRMAAFSLEGVLREKHRSFADLKRRLRRECFEHDTQATERIPIQVVELFSVL